MGVSPVTVKVWLNDGSVFTAITDELTSGEVDEVNITSNLMKGGVPTLAGFCHERVTVLEEVLTTVILCGELGGPADVWISSGFMTGLI